MCGLVGIACTTFTQPKVDVFKKMLYMDTLRGWDSTGAVCGRSKDMKMARRPVRYYKRALAGPDFLPTRGFQSIVRDVTDIRFLMGHNRAATKGSVIDENAHPFVGDNIVLAHNGSLVSWNNLAEGKGNNYVVDSEAIMHHLDWVDDEALPEALAEINGAFALTWFDQVEDSLYFVRNEERPLFFADILNYQGTEKVGLMWSSVPEFITYTAEKHSLNITTPEETEVGRLYKFSADGSELQSEREVNVHVPKKYNSWGGTTGGQAKSTSHNGSSTPASSQSNASQKSQQTSSSGLVLVGTSGGTPSQTPSGKTSAPTGQSTTNSEPAGGPCAGHWIEFAVYADSLVAHGDYGQQMGWCRCANGKKYNVVVTNVPKSQRLHGIFRARVISRFALKDTPTREDYSGTKVRVNWHDCQWVDDTRMAQYDSSHVTDNYDKDNRDLKAAAIDLSSCFPKGRSALEIDAASHKVGAIADTREFHVGDDNTRVNAYALEALLAEACPCCECRVSRDAVYAGKVEWYGMTPVHEGCVDEFLDQSFTGKLKA